LEAAEVIHVDRLKEIKAEANELVGILTTIIKNTKENSK